MFLRRLIRTIAIVTIVASPAALSAQGPPSNEGSNARSGAAEGGAIGTVDSVSPSSFTVLTSAGQKVTVQEASSTEYRKGTNSIPASALTKGDSVLVLGIVNGQTITASQVIVQTADKSRSATSSAGGVIPSSAVRPLRQSGSVRSQPITVKGQGRS